MSVQPEAIAGLVLLLSGWLVIPLALRTLGALFGAALGILVIDVCVLTLPEFYPSPWFYVISAATFGALGLFFAVKLFTVLVFACGIVGALALKLQLDAAFDLSRNLAEGPMGDFALSPWFTLLFAVVAGVLLALLKKYLIIVMTALAGAALIVHGTSFEEKSVVIAVVGAAFQTLCSSILSSRRKKD